MEFFFGNEDELKEAIDKANMSGEDKAHSMERFILAQDEEGLKTLASILVNAESKLFRGYMQGRIAQIASDKFGVCPGCGRKHDEELNALLKPLVEEPPSPEPSPLVGDAAQQHILISEEDRHNMERYHLDDAYEEGSERFVGFICTGTDGKGPCGMTYPTIEDRMRREPDECGGCIQRAKFG